MKSKQHVEENEDLLVFKIRCASLVSFTHTENTHKGAFRRINFCIREYSAAGFHHILNMHHMAYLPRLLNTCYIQTLVPQT